MFTLAASAQAAPLTKYEAKYVVTPLAQFVTWAWSIGVPINRKEIAQAPPRGALHPRADDAVEHGVSRQLSLGALPRSATRSSTGRSTRPDGRSL